MHLIQCVVLDTTPLFAYGLSRVLEEHGLGSVVGTATTLDELVTLVQTISPNLMLLANEPSPVVIEASCALGVPTVLFASSYRRSDLLAMRHSGIKGFVDKTLRLDEILHVLSVVSEGGHCPPRTEVRENHVELLTKREREIVGLIVEGYSNKQLALRLGIATQTAKNHLKNIMVKIGVESRSQLCAWGLRAQVPYSAVS